MLVLCARILAAKLVELLKPNGSFKDAVRSVAQRSDGHSNGGLKLHFFSVLQEHTIWLSSLIDAAKYACQRRLPQPSCVDDVACIAEMVTAR